MPSHAIRIGGKEDYDRIVSGGLPYGGATTQPVPIGPDGLPIVFPIVPSVFLPPGLAITPGVPVQIGPDGLPIRFPVGPPVFLPPAPYEDSKPLIPPDGLPFGDDALELPPDGLPFDEGPFPEQEAGLLPGLPESLIPSPETVKKAGEGLLLVQQILLVGFLYGLFKNVLAKRDEAEGFLET